MAFFLIEKFILLPIVHIFFNVIPMLGKIALVSNYVIIKGFLPDHHPWVF